MWWNRVLSLVVAAAVVVMHFKSVARIEHFWASILLKIIPTVLALISIWFGEEIEDWFGNIAFPAWTYQVLGWLVLIVEAVDTFVSWRVVVPYLAS